MDRSSLNIFLTALVFGMALISFRTMAYVQANSFLVEPYQTPKEDLFLRATSFQESIEEAFTSDYNSDDVTSHPDYRKEFHALLSTYYEGVLEMKGASGVTSTSSLALRRTPQKPSTDLLPVDSAAANPVPVAPAPAAPAQGQPLTSRTTQRRRRRPRRGRNVTKGDRKTNKSCCARWMLCSGIQKSNRYSITGKISFGGLIVQKWKTDRNMQGI